MSSLRKPDVALGSEVNRFKATSVNPATAGSAHVQPRLPRHFFVREIDTHPGR